MLNKLQKNWLLAGLSFFFLIALTLSAFTLQPLWITLSFGIIFIGLTNIFFLLISDKKVLYFYLLALFFFLSIVILMFGGLFSLGLISLALTIVGLVTLFSYIAFSEIEKNQLSSRLFSLGQSTRESVKILSTSLVLLISILTFAGLYHQGGEKTIEKAFTNSDVVQEIIIGQGEFNNTSIHLNKLFMSGLLNFGDKTNPSTFYNFLHDNYTALTGELILSGKEQDSIMVNHQNPNAEINRIKTERAEALLQDKFSDLGFGLETVLDKAKYIQVSKKYYTLKINSYEEKVDSGLLSIIPRDSHLPGVLTVLLLIFLFVIRFIISMISILVIRVYWQILLWTEFAKIEVEVVEAEVIKI